MRGGLARRVFMIDLHRLTYHPLDVGRLAAQGPGAAALLVRDAGRRRPRPARLLDALPRAGRAARVVPPAALGDPVQVAALPPPQPASPGTTKPEPPDGSPMNLALCYPSVIPQQGGCETYIAGLARRLVGDGHAVHLYACRWDAAALPGRPRVPRGAPAALPALRPRLAVQPGLLGAARAGPARRRASASTRSRAWTSTTRRGGNTPPRSASARRSTASRLVRAGLRLARRLDPTHQSLLSLERRQLAPAGFARRRHQRHGARPPAGAGRRSRRSRCASCRSRRCRDRLREDDRPARRAAVARPRGASAASDVRRPVRRDEPPPQGPRAAAAGAGPAARRAAGRRRGRVRAVRPRSRGSRGGSASTGACASPATAPTCATPTSRRTCSSTRPSTTPAPTSSWRRWRAACPSSRPVNGAGEQMRCLDAGGACDEGRLLADPHDDAALARATARADRPRPPPGVRRRGAARGGAVDVRRPLSRADGDPARVPRAGGRGARRRVRPPCRGVARPPALAESARLPAALRGSSSSQGASASQCCRPLCPRPAKMARTRSNRPTARTQLIVKLMSLHDILKRQCRVLPPPTSNGPCTPNSRSPRSC